MSRSNLTERLKGFAYKRVALIVLIVVALLTCNVSAWRKYSVDDGDMVLVYGMPFTYAITHCGDNAPILTHRIGEAVSSRSNVAPPPRPPIMPFRLAAAVANVAISSVIVLASWFLLFYGIPRMRALQPFGRRTLTIAAVAALLAFVMLACAYTLRRFERHQNVLNDIACRRGLVWTEYPGPEVLWSTVQAIAGKWIPPEQIGTFLDASVGTVVRLRGPTEVLHNVADLPALEELLIIPDDARADAPPGPLMFSDEDNVPRPDSLRGSAKDAVQLQRVVIGTGVCDSSLPIIFGFIGQLPRLRFLELSGKFSIESLGTLPSLRTLESLDLSDCAIPDGVIQFSEFPALRSLSLSGATVTGEDGYGFTEKSVRDLEHLSHLTDLDLGEVGLGEGAIRSLAHLSSLRNLTLAGDVGDDDLKYLSGLTELRFLDISDNNITIEGIKNLVKLRKLEAINLQHTKITDDAVSILTDLPSLRVIDLRDTDLSDHSIDALLKINSLRHVFLEGTHVTAAGGIRLKQLPMLQTLTLGPRGKGLSAAELDELRQRMPNLDVLGVLRYWPPSATTYNQLSREDRWQ